MSNMSAVLEDLVWYRPEQVGTDNRPLVTKSGMPFYSGNAVGFSN